MSDERRDVALQELVGKSWSELEALEFGGRLLFSSELKRFRSDGALESVPVKLRIPRAAELRKARIESRRLALAAKLDLDRDKDLIDGLENLVILAESIRNVTPPHEPYEPDPIKLEKDWDSDSLGAIWAHLDALKAAIDPAPHDMTEEETLQVLAQIAEKRSIAPLVVYAPSARARFIVTMASLLLGSLVSKSSSGSSGSSTPV